MIKRRMMSVAWTVAAGIAHITSADAQVAVNENMSCRAVREILDVPDPDRAKMREMLDIFNLIEGVFAQMDRANTTKGRPAIFARMSKDGQQNTVAMATSRCETHPDDTIKKSTGTVYKGIESIGKAMGIN